MALWGKSTTAESRPKFLPIDSNAQGSSGSRQDAIAVDGGWALSPGHANSGNDNKDAQPEILVCIRNLAEVFGSATPISIGWTEAEVADTGTFDITVTFDEAVDVTSAAWSANQTVTNKAYILLSRLGVTDMVEDSTVACQYYSGDGTNQITFRGTVQTNAAAGFLAFNGAGVGDTASEGRTAIFFNGSADMAEEDGGSILGLMQESGTRDTHGDKIVLNGTDANSTDADDDVQLEDASGNIERESEKIASLTSPEKNNALFKLSKEVVKTLLTATNDGASDSQITVRRQFVGTTTTGGVTSISVGANIRLSSRKSPWTRVEGSGMSENQLAAFRTKCSLISVASWVRSAR